MGLSSIKTRLCTVKTSVSRNKMKAKITWMKVYDYVRYDLKEIAFPSSLPNPPGYKPPRKLTWEERWLVLKKATRLYCASWVRDIGPDLRPEDYEHLKETDPNGKKHSSQEKGPSSWEELAVASRGGMEMMRPVLQKIYMTKASTYSEALKSFIKGYQEGIQDVMEKKENSKSEQKDDAPKI